MNVLSAILEGGPSDDRAGRVEEVNSYEVDIVEVCILDDRIAVFDGDSKLGIRDGNVAHRRASVSTSGVELETIVPGEARLDFDGDGVELSSLGDYLAFDVDPHTGAHSDCCAGKNAKFIAGGNGVIAIHIDC